MDLLNQYLDNNPGLVILKFGATWCGPCKTIEQDVLNGFRNMPSNVKCYMIDVDENPKLYSFFKSKRMFNGVPALLCYYKDNTSYIPNDIIIGADKRELYGFFARCRNQSIEN